VIIEEKNQGKKINYLVSDTTINFDSTLSINLSRYQKDIENVVDICLDNDMQLTTGLGKWYAASIILPPKEYTEIDTGKEDSDGHEIYNKILNPLDMEKVKLVLWALPYGYELQGGNN
jgi:hypothetical protein